MANARDEDHQTDLYSELIESLGRELSIECLIHLSRSHYNKLASLNRSFRSLVRSGQLYKYRRVAGILEDWIYISCSVLEWEVFNPDLHSWMRLPPVPPNQIFMFADKQSLAFGTDILVFGKDINSYIIYKYSILSNSWSSVLNMNTPRCLFSGACRGEIMIVAGGFNSEGSVLNSVELYNSEDGTWENLPSMHKCRKMCSSFFLDDKYYVLGGHNGNISSETFTCGEEYDFQTRSWRVIPNMYPITSAPNQPPPSIIVLNNKLYAADFAEMVLRKYDKENNSWLTLGKLPESAVSLNGWGLAFRACGERLITVGGSKEGGGVVEIHSWVPRDGPPHWELLATKRLGGFVYNCAVMSC